MKILTLIVFVLFTATASYSAVSGDVLGVWKTDGGDSQVELFRCGEKVCGKIVWLKVPQYIDISDGPLGQTKVNLKSPDPAQKNRPIVGLQVIKELTPGGVKRWVGGTCYDPESGKSYKCTMQQTESGRLELRGYIGIALFGRTFGLSRQYNPGPHAER
jgi:uncharacterized protein (DUF2147 family)